VRRAGLCVLALLPVLLCAGSADAVSSTAVPAWTLVLATGRGLDVLTSERPRPHVLLRHRRGSNFTDNRPKLSPDGRRVSFFRSARPPFDGLWVLDLRGGTPRHLARGFIDDFSWSRDGTTIAFSRNLGEPGAGIFAVDSHGGRVRRLFPSGGFPRWSPDGRRLLCMCGRGLPIWVFDSDGGRRRRVTRQLGAMTRASWSPDGRRIAYGRGCFNVAAGEDTWCKLTILDPDTRSKRAVPRATYLVDRQPVWASTQSMLLPCQLERHGCVSVVSLDVTSGATRAFYGKSGWVFASPVRTAFVVLIRNRLVLLDSSKHVLGRWKLPISESELAFDWGFDVHVR
jgi:Tol biopolymer transport system component